jgi:transcriptional regulator with XRE-family HTH domain
MLPFDRKYRKRPSVESQVGMSFEQWLHEVAEPKGMEQADIARALGVQEITVGKWLNDLGLVKVPRYVPREEVAA